MVWCLKVVVQCHPLVNCSTVGFESCLKSKCSCVKQRKRTESEVVCGRNKCRKGEVKEVLVF